jgi:hypothetical protein
MYFIKLIIAALVFELVSCFAPPEEEKLSSSIKIIETEQHVQAMVTACEDKIKSPGALTIQISIP